MKLHRGAIICVNLQTRFLVNFLVKNLSKFAFLASKQNKNVNITLNNNKNTESNLLKSYFGTMANIDYFTDRSVKFWSVKYSAYQRQTSLKKIY